jgi:hypothetical protein
MTELDQAVVVVPAHNELEHLPRCLRALTTASRRLTMPVLMIVVLDACDDGSDSLAEQFGPDVRARPDSSTRDQCAAPSSRSAPGSPPLMLTAWSVASGWRG